MPADAKNPEIGSKEKSSKQFGIDFSQIAFGTLISQIILVFLTPIITRIYDPAMYGIASTFIAVTNIFLVICCFRYEQAIMLPEDNRDAVSLFFACVLILSIFSIVLIPICLIFGDLITSLLHLSELQSYLFLLPIVLFVGGLSLLLKFWNLRKKRFGIQATTQVVQYVVYPGCQIGLGVSGFTTAGSLILSDLFAKISCVGVYLYRLVRDDAKMFSCGISLNHIWSQLLKYKKFPLINTWAELLYCLSWQLPVLLLSAFFSSDIAGQYSLAYRTLLLPLSLVGSSIGMVLFQRASVAVHNGTLGPLVEDIVVLIFTISALPLLVIGILGPDIFSIIFSSQWELAGTFVQILSIWMIIWFVASPLMNLINVLGIQGFGLKYNLVSVIVRSLALVLGILLGDVYIALLLFMLFGLVLDGYVSYVLVSKSGCPIRNIFRRVLSPCLVSLAISLMIIVVHLISGVMSGYGAVTAYISVGLAIVFCAGYVVYLFRKNKVVRDYLRIWKK